MKMRQELEGRKRKETIRRKIKRMGFFFHDLHKGCGMEVTSDNNTGEGVHLIISIERPSEVSLK